MIKGAEKEADFLTAAAASADRFSLEDCGENHYAKRQNGVICARFKAMR